jgi:hypothetical protein
MGKMKMGIDDEKLLLMNESLLGVSCRVPWLVVWCVAVLAES